MGEKVGIDLVTTSDTTSASSLCEMAEGGMESGGRRRESGGCGGLNWSSCAAISLSQLARSSSSSVFSLACQVRFRRFTGCRVSGPRFGRSSGGRGDARGAT